MPGLPCRLRAQVRNLALVHRLLNARLGSGMYAAACGVGGCSVDAVSSRIRVVADMDRVILYFLHAMHLQYLVSPASSARSPMIPPLVQP